MTLVNDILTTFNRKIRSWLIELNSEVELCCNTKIDQEADKDGQRQNFPLWNKRVSFWILPQKGCVSHFKRVVQVQAIKRYSLLTQGFQAWMIFWHCVFAPFHHACNSISRVVRMRWNDVNWDSAWYYFLFCLFLPPLLFCLLLSFIRPLIFHSSQEYNLSKGNW